MIWARAVRPGYVLRGSGRHPGDRPDSIPPSILRRCRLPGRCGAGGRYFDPGSAWNPRPIWRAGSWMVTALFRVTSVVNTPLNPRPSSTPFSTELADMPHHWIM